MANHDLSQLLSVLSDPTRRAVVERLTRGPAAIKELAGPHDMALPSFLKHVDALERAGLITSWKEGRQRFCRMNRLSLDPVRDWLNTQQSRLRPYDMPSDDPDPPAPAPDAKEPEVDQSRDLILTRLIPASPMTVWRCWAEAGLLKRWFTPAPVETVEARIEPRPGGAFFTRMRLPDGTEIASEGCVLIADPGSAFGFTDALSGGYRPGDSPFMTGMLSFAPEGDGTRYTARLLHSSPEARARHEEMGFQEGWGKATDQLATLAASLKD